LLVRHFRSSRQKVTGKKIAGKIYLGYGQWTTVQKASNINKQQAKDHVKIGLGMYAPPPTEQKRVNN
jgi:hypothetical protein